MADASGVLLKDLLLGLGAMLGPILGFVASHYFQKRGDDARAIREAEARSEARIEDSLARRREIYTRAHSYALRERAKVAAPQADRILTSLG